MLLDEIPSPALPATPAGEEILDLKDALRALQILAVDGRGYRRFMDPHLFRNILEGQGLQILAPFFKEFLLIAGLPPHYIIDRLFSLFDALDQPKRRIHSVRQIFGQASSFSASCSRFL